VTRWTEGEDGVVLAEGEAGGAYADLQGFRRSVLWVPGSYILILDHISAPRRAGITWLLQSQHVDVQDPEAGLYRLRDDEASLDVQVVSSRAFESRVADASADHRGKLLGYRQLQLTVEAEIWSVASLYNAWDRQPLSVSLQQDGASFRATVAGPDFTDTWTWTPPDGPSVPTALLGRRGPLLLLQTDTPPPVETGAADFDGDGRVAFADFVYFAGTYGSGTDQSAYDTRCDLNANGQIDFADFLLFSQAYGSTATHNAA